MTNIRSLPRLMTEPIVRAALLEDLGRAGDLTTDSIIGPEATATVRLVAREPGVLAGIDLAALAWDLVDPRIAVDVHLRDGSRLEPGSAIATATGPARGLLTGERVVLNFLGHLSGVATGTARIADAIAHTRAKVADNGGSAASRASASRSGLWPGRSGRCGWDIMRSGSAPSQALLL